MIVANSFEKILNHSISVSKETSHFPCTRAEQEASVFLHKNILSAYTSFSILDPIPRPISFTSLNGVVLFDFPSAYVIARAMFETYVNMHYLLIDPASDEEREFRLDRWDKHSLTERQKMGIAIGSSDQKLKDEAKQIIEIDMRILQSRYFRQLPVNEQKSIKYSHNWTNLGAIARADKADIHCSQSEFLYKFFSNYSHSESYSLMQLHDADPNQSQQSCKLACNFAEMFLALTLNAFGKLNVDWKNKVAQNNEVFQIIKFWELTKQQDLKVLLTK